MSEAFAEQVIYGNIADRRYDRFVSARALEPVRHAGKDVKKMADLSNTQFIDINQSKRIQVSEVIQRVYDALEEEGYSAESRTDWYIMVGLHT